VEVRAFWTGSPGARRIQTAIDRTNPAHTRGWEERERMTFRTTTLRDVTLDDKYDLTQTSVFVTGYQALIRLCLMQKARDRAAGLNTAGYVTGYRGSPLGGLDQQFARAEVLCRQNDILCRPAINEDLAATACGGRSRPNCAARAGSTAFSACSTPKAPASTGPATSSAMPMRPARRRTVASSP